MTKLWYSSLGKKDFHLILLHGWGVHAEIWNCIHQELASYFTLHLIDLPGFGRSSGFGAIHIEEMAEHILKKISDKAIWLGWSLGGLVASQIAITYPQYVRALITVSSSPCFSAKKEWPGIKKEILTKFQQQLDKDFLRTIEQFLILQTLGTKTAKKDIRTLRKTFLSLPFPEIKILKGGIEIIKNVDFRESFTNFLLPHLRIYGSIDSLVPCKISTILDKYWPKSKSLIIEGAAHVPFISHPKEFCNAIVALHQKLY